MVSALIMFMIMIRFTLGAGLSLIGANEPPDRQKAFKFEKPLFHKWNATPPGE